MAFNFIFLTEQFYNDYANCSEIESKRDRPHVRTLIRLFGLDFAIPFRSNIKHNYAYITDKQNHCGLDFSKAVVIKDITRYINTTRKPIIRQSEFDALRGKEHIIETNMLKFITKYHKALARPDIPRHARLLQYTTLQYFPELSALIDKPT